MNPNFLNDLMQNAKNLQSNMEKERETFFKQEFLGKVAGGLVQVTINGRHDVLRVNIHPDVFQEEKAILEDLIAAAVNDANRQLSRAEENMAKNMQKFAPDLSVMKDFFKS